MGAAAQRLVVVGAGGLGLEVAWAARAMECWDYLGYADADASKVGRDHYGDPVLCRPEELADALGNTTWFVLAIGENRARRELAAILEGQGLRAATIVHPHARLGPGARVAEGSYVAIGATLAPHGSIGRHVLVNINAIVGHECVVGDFSQVSPGAVVTGQCRLGAGVFIGSNACLHPGTQVGDWAAVAANSFAATHVEAGHTVMGIPARPIFRRK